MDLEASKIREVANAGLGRDDVLAFWFGEGDEVTPDFVRQAAIDSLQQGETYYAHNLGLPALRQAISIHMSENHPGPHRQGVSLDRVAVTAGGVNALMLAVQALVNPGDEVLAITPVWPNLVAQPRIMGAHLRTLSLQVVNGGWQLDLDNACAPSFLDVADPQDRLVVVHSFSKSFLMTGWRLGWLVMPPEMTDAMGKLIEFNTSCCSVFTQRAGLAALQRRQEITPRVVAHLKSCRDTLVGALQSLPGLELSLPLGGMYAFFRIPGHHAGLVTAKRLVAEAGLGLAPGEAFGPEAAGWLRWCFASQDPQRLRLGVERLQAWIRL